MYGGIYIYSMAEGSNETNNTTLCKIVIMLYTHTRSTIHPFIDNKKIKLIMEYNFVTRFNKVHIQEEDSHLLTLNIDLCVIDSLVCVGFFLFK